MDVVQPTLELSQAEPVAPDSARSLLAPPLDAIEDALI